MAEIKRYFAALKHIVPSDLEYYLEEEHSSGHILQEFGQGGLFYYRFTEAKPEKCAYVVDVTSLPKALYLRTLAEQGWEPLGRSMNCYVWRQYYEGKKRPESFADRACLRGHCLRLGIVSAAVALLFLTISFLYFYFLYIEKKQGIQTHFWSYLIFGILNLPFFAYCAWAARGLLGEAGKLKVRLEVGRELSRRPSAEKADEGGDELSSL